MKDEYRLYILMFVDSKKFYIGVTKDVKTRITQHLRGETNLLVKKLINNKEFPKIFLSDFYSEESISLLETRAIANSRIKSKNTDWECLNIRKGGEGVRKSLSFKNYLINACKKYKKLSDLIKNEVGVYNSVHSERICFLAMSHMEDVNTDWLISVDNMPQYLSYKL